MPSETELNKVFKLVPARNETEVVIYTETPASRLAYVCRFVFNHVLRVNYRVSHQISDLDEPSTFKINYSNTDLEGVFSIRPHSLLSESGWGASKPRKTARNGIPYFFGNQDGNLAYDLFSAVFYFLSRYEEWQEFKPDRHKRFEASSSILFEGQAHLRPVVDIWIQEMALALQKFYPGLNFPERRLQVISTIDVDNLYAYKAKGFFRTLGASLRDVLKLDFKNLNNRLTVVSGNKKDPFDVYDAISAFCAESQIPLFWFFLFRSGTRYDRTVDPTSGAQSFKNVFKQVERQGAHMGLHPSYDSAYETGLMEKEIKAISACMGKKVELSRQHFLRFDIRTTPGLLLRNGILADFTMGYAGSAGFRAGTSFPFYYYDLSADQATDLLFVPFCAMDGAYTVYEQSDPEQALQSMLKMADEVKQVGGFFTTVFHERTFSDHLYKGFGPLYKNLHQKLKEF